MFSLLPFPIELQPVHLLPGFQERKNPVTADEGGGDTSLVPGLACVVSVHLALYSLLFQEFLLHGLI